jgi:hypothetical protein
MTMKPGSLLKAIFLPVIEPAMLFVLLLFWVLVSIGTSGSPMGLLVLILSLPPIFRYQTIILEACAKGEVPAAFDAEFFSWGGNMWTLFPLPLVVGLVLLGVAAEHSFGSGGVFAVLALAGGILPASLAVLAITHSPLQSLNPIAIGRLLKSAGESFWFASAYLFSIGWGAIQAEQLPNIAGNFIQLFVLFSFSAVTGTLLEPFGLVDDVSIPDALDASDDAIKGDLEVARAAVLTHAYGFVSRNNREGGFRHITEWIAKETDVVGAWAWFFDRMLRWEQKQHALFFAQQYIHDMLLHGEKVPALKVIMRCRLVNEQFHPSREDIPAAIEAAESTGNIELAAVLKRV